jgi:hypothetical protein
MSEPCHFCPSCGFDGPAQDATIAELREKLAAAEASREAAQAAADAAWAPVKERDAEREKFLVLADEHNLLTAKLDAERARAEMYAEALRQCIAELERIANRPCSGTYGPCGDANTSASNAEDALEIIRAALKGAER